MKHSKSDERLQRLMQHMGFYEGDLDGLWGRGSQEAYIKYAKSIGVKEIIQPKGSILDANGKVKPEYLIGHYSTALMRENFGEVGTNQIRIPAPYRMVLSWDTNQRIPKITCHKKIAEPLSRALTAVKAHYGQEEIDRLGLNLFGGSLNVRRMRGGSAWSSHAWGTAFDIDTTNNRMRQRPATTSMARPDNKAFCDIMVEHGFGTIEYDLMHWQFKL